MDLSIIILNYKSKGLVRNCLKSVYRHTQELDFEVIVVDNNSCDGIKEELKSDFSKVKFLEAPKNLGYSAGNNLGIQEAQGKYIVIVNPDISLQENSFKKMYDFMQKNEKIGILGPCLVNPDGTLQYTRCRYPQFLMPVYRRTWLKRLKFIKKKIDYYLTKDKDYSSPSVCDWLFGACLFVRKKALDQVGLLDERFFLGFEDTDWCRRFWGNNYEVWYFPKTKLIHYPHRFSRNNFFSKSVRIHIASWLKYFLKYGFRKPYSKLN